MFRKEVGQSESKYFYQMLFDSPETPFMFFKLSSCLPPNENDKTSRYCLSLLGYFGCILLFWIVSHFLKCHYMFIWTISKNINCMSHCKKTAQKSFYNLSTHYWSSFPDPGSLIVNIWYVLFCMQTRRFAFSPQSLILLQWFIH